MAAYQLRILTSAARELSDLDRSAGARIVKRLRWLAENLDDLKPQTLTGELKSLYSSGSETTG